MASDIRTPVSSGDHHSRRRIKAHHKSRQGCFTCKGRKVKCCEARPECRNCLRSHLTCVYPEAQPMAISSASPGSKSRIGKVLYQSRGYSLRDMRFFHDFITASYPHLPLESDAAWQNHVPIMAQEHEFLMHAILAVGASHLHARTNIDLTATVEKHRTLALHGLTDSQPEEQDDSCRESRLNAQLAAAYCLTFCASYMGDPMSRFLVLARGCSSLTGHLLASGYFSPSFFRSTNPGNSDDHVAVMRRRLEKASVLPYVDQVEPAKYSLDKMAATCIFTPIEWKLLTSLRGILEQIAEPFKSYQHLIEVWDMFTTMSADEFAHFISDSNKTSALLQAHFLAIEEMIRPWTSLQLSEGRFDGPDSRLSKSAIKALPASDVFDGASSSYDWPRDFIRRAYDRECRLIDL